VPTTYPRAQVTLTPDVQRVIDYGQTRWPNKPPGAVLVALAKEAMPAEPRSRMLKMLPKVPGHVVTFVDVQSALYDD